jgi:hypothetical protein
MTGDLEDLVERRRRDKDVRRITTLRPRWSRLGYYKGGVSEEALKAEQKRIEAERTQTQERADAGEREVEVEVEVEDVMAALDDALLLLNETKIIYEVLPANIRRLVNQAVFVALTVRDADTVDAQGTPLQPERSNRASS